jgi:hypothetical protein
VSSDAQRNYSALRENDALLRRIDALMFVKEAWEPIPISALMVGVAGYFLVWGGSAGLRARQGRAARVEGKLL